MRDRETSSAEESRALLRTEDNEGFDVVVTDSFMGDESGIDFIRSLRKGGVQGLSRFLPCILCSGEQHEFTDKRTVSITKPFSSNDIARALNDLKLSKEQEIRV